MELTIALTLLFMGLFLFSNPRNTYHLLFSGMLAGVSLAMSVTLLLATRGSSYDFSLHSSPLPIIRFGFYQRLSFLFQHVSWSGLVKLRNMGISIYLLCIMLFIHSFYDSTFHARRKHSTVTLILMSAMSLTFFGIYHPGISFRIYVHYHRLLYVSPAQAMRFGHLVRAGYSAMTLLYIVCLIYPSFYLIQKGIRRQISFFSGQLIGLALSLGLMNSALIVLFFFSDLHFSVNRMLATGYWSLHQIQHLPAFYTLILPFIMLIVLSVSFYFTLWFGIDSVVGRMRERRIRKNLDHMYLNLRNVFHSDKNLFFSIQKLCESAIEKSDGDSKELLQIKSLCDAQVDMLTNTLNYIKKINLRNSTADLIQVIESALGEISASPDLTIQRDYPTETVDCYLDTYHLVQLFTNIFHNAADAMHAVQRPGQLSIRVENSRDWIFCAITDNGCGMPKSQRSRRALTRPIEPTRPNHFGIGLPYIYQVVQAHGGHIRFRSKAGRFTTVEILLPQARKRRKRG